PTHARHPRWQVWPYIRPSGRPDPGLPLLTRQCVFRPRRLCHLGVPLLGDELLSMIPVASRAITGGPAPGWSTVPEPHPGSWQTTPATYTIPVGRPWAIAGVVAQ